MFGKKLFAASVVFFVTFITAPVSWAGLVVSLENDAVHRERAQTQTPSVHWMEGFDSNGVGRVRASGVQIHENWILTAGHVFDSIPGGTVRFGTGPNFINDRGFYQDSSDIFIHPDFQRVGWGPDLALVRFDNPFPGPSTSLYRGDLNLGDDLIISGFGRFGEAGDTTLTRDGFARAGDTVMSQFGRSTWPDKDNYIGARFVGPNHSDFRELGILITPGDSGGGWFIDVDGELQLAGISSNRDLTTDFNSRSFAAKLDLDWIGNTTGVTAIPEPNSFAVFALGFIVIGFFAHRRSKLRKA